MTGHQKRSDAPKKQACSSLCHAVERSAKSKAAGTCQAQSVSAITLQQVNGCVIAVPTRRSAGHRRKGPTPSRANFLGSPRSSGRSGEPSRISGGATDRSNRCCTMWAERRKPENASSGEAIASQKVASPPANAPARQTGNRSGEVRCKMNQPRRWRRSEAARPKASFGSKDQELRMA